ncbi:MAG: hypothetical protein LKH23_07090 [Atopobiaceae bacterium]|nr:hypothetical protein [Atopobiaceae bacterium]MCI1471121.1 hypothetical protein [Atopobiaceae bacterium]
MLRIFAAGLIVFVLVGALAGCTRNYDEYFTPNGEVTVSGLVDLSGNELSDACAAHGWTLDDDGSLVNDDDQMLFITRYKDSESGHDENLDSDEFKTSVPGRERNDSYIVEFGIHGYDDIMDAYSAVCDIETVDNRIAVGQTSSASSQTQLLAIAADDAGNRYLVFITGSKNDERAFHGTISVMSEGYLEVDDDGLDAVWRGLANQFT